MKVKKWHTLLLLVLVCLVLLGTGTYAAYTNTAYVKRVAIAKGSVSVLPFSSNYLSEREKDSSTDYVKQIITSSEDENGIITGIIHLAIYNYPLNDVTKFSSDDIHYGLEIKVIDKDGNKVDNSSVNLVVDPSDYASGTLQGGQASPPNQYTITCSGSLDDLSEYLIRVTATPQNLPKCLGADFQIVPASAQNAQWSGSFAETDGSYDAFNYVISGTAEEDFTLTWDPNQVAISPWFLQEMGISADDAADGSITFHVGGEGKPTSYRIQFYRVGDFPGLPNIS